MRISTIAVGGLVGLAALFGSGVAHADTAQEKQACNYMNDPTGASLGYTPAEYALMMLTVPDDVSGESMSNKNALQVMRDAVQDFCPKHAADVP